jgi:hypothetical protein
LEFIECCLKFRVCHFPSFRISWETGIPTSSGD